jgi:hypothetical protein
MRVLQSERFFVRHDCHTESHTESHNLCVVHAVNHVLGYECFKSDDLTEAVSRLPQLSQARRPTVMLHLLRSMGVSVLNLTKNSVHWQKPSQIKVSKNRFKQAVS